MKHIALFFTLFLLPIFASAQNYAFATNTDGTLTITSVTGAAGPISLPSLTNGLTVTGIGYQAFFNTSITVVGIPASITSIGQMAFESCSFLTNFLVNPANPAFSSGADGVLFDKSGATLITYPPGLTNQTYTIPGTVTDLGYLCFGSATRLTQMTIPATVTGIGAGPFYYCLKLTNITVDGANPNYSSVGGVLFDKAKKNLVQYPLNLATVTYTIPPGVTNLGDFSFFNCNALTSVVFDTALARVGNQAFEDASTITNIMVNDNLASLGTNAFLECGFTTLNLPFSLSSIPSGAFELCTKLKNITIPNTITNIGFDAFGDCVMLTNLAIPASVVSIGDAAFSVCLALTNISVDAANPNYSSLGGVLFNKSQTTVLAYPAGLPSKTYILPTSTANISDYAFYVCGGLTNFVIPDAVTNIGFSAFGICSGLLSVTVGSGVTNIGADAFISCRQLTNILFLGNAPVISSNVFESTGSGATVYYLPGATGWSNTFGGLPAVLLAPALTFSNIGVHTNQFGFTFTGATGQHIIIEAATNLAPPITWLPLQTNILTSTSTNFSDTNWTQFPTRFYRLHAP